MAPPVAFDTQVKRKGRSSSFNSFLSRLLPSNREEKGGTFRTEVCFALLAYFISVAFLLRFWDVLTSYYQVQGLTTSENELDKHESVEETSAVAPSIGARLLSLNRKSRGSENHCPPPSNDDPSKTQQMFYDKKAQRINRRSLKESGDYLGVQGANPRTGIWDPSASSSDPSQMSEEARKRLDEEAKNVAEQKRRYDEAQAKLHEEHLQRRAARERRRAQKSEQRREEMRLRQRRHGRWRMG